MNNRINKKNYIVNKKKQKNREKFKHIDQRFIHSMRRFLKEHGDAFILVFVAIIILAHKRRAITVHRKIIAHFAGVCETTVSRIVNDLYEAGLITIHQHRTTNGHLHNTYVLSNVLNLFKVRRNFFSAIKYSLSEYVTMLKDSLLTLYKNIKILVSKKRYNFRKELHILQRDTHCILRE